MSASGMYPRQFSGTDRGTTIRNPATALLCIDSEDRFADMDQSRVLSGTDNPYDFLVTKSENILSGFFTRIGVTEVMFPWVIPNINKKTNIIQFIYKVGAGPENASFVSITQGFYKPSQIAAAVQTAIRAINPALAAFNVIYGLNNRCRFDFEPNNPAVTFKINPITSTNIPLLPLASDQTFWNSQNLRTVHQLFDLLGLAIYPIFQPLLVGRTTLCQFTRYIDIVSTQLTYNQSLKDSSTSLVTRDVLCRIYLADSGSVNNVAPSSPDFCPFGCAPFTIYRDFSSPKLINWLPNQNIPGSVRLTVYADDGSVLTQPSLLGTLAQENIYWSLTLQVSEN